MGQIERHYNPTEDIMAKYKPWKFEEVTYQDNTLEYIKNGELELLIYCLEDHSEESTLTVIKHLRFALQYLNHSYKEYLKASVYKEWKENSEIIIFGNDNYYYEDCNDVIDRNIDGFLMLCKVVKTDNYFGGVESHYYDKVQDIKDKIEYVTDCFRDCFNEELREDIKDFYQDPYSDLKSEYPELYPDPIDNLKTEEIC